MNQSEYKDLKKIAGVIRGVADDLDALDPDDFESLDDCIDCTMINSVIGLSELKEKNKGIN